MSPPQVALLALLWGFFGAILGLLASYAFSALCDVVFDSDWYLDRQDRLYIAEINAECDEAAAAFSRQVALDAKQAGRISLPALLAVAVGLVVYLGACAAPEPRFTGSDAWHDRVVKGGW